MGRRTTALRKFRSFIRVRQRRLVSGRLEQNILKEDVDDTPITDAATVFIGSELCLSKRKALCEGFVNDIEEMCESGRSIMAIAVAFE
jgi:hypothetical protein